VVSEGKVKDERERTNRFDIFSGSDETGEEAPEHFRSGEANARTDHTVLKISSDWDDNQVAYIEIAAEASRRQKDVSLRGREGRTAAYVVK
jgi:hypothetical protein